jgi:transcriptional regulator of acetoin/glycerol metabolism
MLAVIATAEAAATGAAGMADHADRVRKTALARAAASPLAASWRRSLVTHGLDPDRPAAPRQRASEAEWKRAHDSLGRIAAIAAPVMDRLILAMGQAGCCVLLTDATGLVVARRSGGADDRTFEAWNLWTGADWSEQSQGTNGIGTCLVERRPVVIHRDQHFRSSNGAMSCVGAPIFDHEGELAGVLDTSSCRTDLAEAFLPLLRDAVGDAARRIEAENFHAAHASRRIIVRPGEGAGGPVLLAVDRDDLLVGATRRARRLYGLSAESFLNPRPVGDLLGEADAAPDLDAAERAELRRALARAGGCAARAARNLGIARASLYRRMARLGLR